MIELAAAAASRGVLPPNRGGDGPAFDRIRTAQGGNRRRRST